MECVPPEFERNFTLLTDLDKRSEELRIRAKEYLNEYKKTKHRDERAKIREITDELFEKIASYADDKIALAQQTYELIDRHIRRFERANDADKAASPKPDDKPKEIFDMPPDENEPKFCVCRNISHGQMVACDNPDCVIEWFHFACVGLDKQPKGKWYCQQCGPEILARARRLNKSKRKRR